MGKTEINIYPNGLISILGVKLGMKYDMARDILLKHNIQVEKNEYNGINYGGFVVRNIKLFGTDGWTILFRSFFSNRIHNILITKCSAIYNDVEEAGEKVISELSEYRKYINIERYREKRRDEYIKTKSFDNTSFSNAYSYVNVSLQYDSDEEVKNTSSYIIIDFHIRCTLNIPKEDFANKTVCYILDSYIDKYLSETNIKNKPKEVKEIFANKRMISFAKFMFIGLVLIVMAYLFALKSRYQVVYNGAAIVDKWEGTIERVRTK